MTNKTYILNKETQKIELYFSKEEYQSLSDELKKELKSGFLFSGKAQAWVSRSINNHFRAIRIAEKLGFTDGGSTGERLSYEEELQRKSEKAEARAERYEQYSENAIQRAENLQGDFNKLRGDIAFITQPNINNSSGRSFTNYRNKIMDRYNKGFKEYRKSEYFKNKAITAQGTADMKQLKDRTYLSNRIKEGNSIIKKLEKNIVNYEEIIYRKENNIEILNSFYNAKSIEEVQKWLNDALEKMEYELDKLAFMENCLEELGTIHSKDTIKVGYLVKIRRGWELVLKVNNKTVETQPLEERLKMFISKYPYEEIQGVKVPDDYKEVKKKIETIENPYNVGDILVSYNISGNRIITAYQVLKTTPKGVTNNTRNKN